MQHSIMFGRIKSCNNEPTRGPVVSQANAEVVHTIYIFCKKRVENFLDFKRIVTAMSVEMPTVITMQRSRRLWIFGRKNENVAHTS